MKQKAELKADDERLKKENKLMKEENQGLIKELEKEKNLQAKETRKKTRK